MNESISTTNFSFKDLISIFRRSQIIAGTDLYQFHIANTQDLELLRKAQSYNTPILDFYVYNLNFSIGEEVSYTVRKNSPLGYIFKNFAEFIRVDLAKVTRSIANIAATPYFITDLDLASFDQQEHISAHNAKLISNYLIVKGLLKALLSIAHHTVNGSVLFFATKTCEISFSSRDAELNNRLVNFISTLDHAQLTTLTAFEQWLTTDDVHCSLGKKAEILAIELPRFVNHQTHFVDILEHLDSIYACVTQISHQD